MLVEKASVVVHRSMELLQTSTSHGPHVSKCLELERIIQWLSKCSSDSALLVNQF
jgi:hypothetical protein